MVGPVPSGVGVLPALVRSFGARLTLLGAGSFGPVPRQPCRQRSTLRLRRRGAYGWGSSFCGA